MTLPIILSSGSLFTFDLDTIMALAVETGFAGLELMVDWRRESYHAAHVQRLSARHGLPVLAVHNPFTEMPGPAWPDDPVASIKRSVALAETLGARTVVVHPPGRWLRLQGRLVAPGWRRKLSLPLPVVGPGELGRWLTKELPAFQARTPVKIAVENMPCRRLGPLTLEPHHFYTPQALAQFQYLTLDTTHVGTRGVDLLAFYKQIASRVIHIHLSNFSSGKQHQLPHAGSLPLTRLLQQLQADAFEGLISLELNPASLEAEDETQLRQHLADSLAFCREALGVGVAPATDG